MNEFRHPTGHHTLTAPPPTDPNPVPDSAPGATRTTNLVSHLRIDKTAPMTSEMIPIVSRIARLAMKPMTSRINRHEHAAASAGPHLYPSDLVVLETSRNSAPMRSGLVEPLGRGVLVTASSAGPTPERRSSTSGTSR